MTVQGPEKQWGGFDDIDLLDYCCIEY